MTELSMKTIQRKLDNIKTELITKEDVAYLRWKMPMFVSGHDVMRVHRNIKIAMKKHGSKIPFGSYMNLASMLTIVDKEMPRFRIPDEFRRDDFAKWESEEKKIW